MNTPNWSKNDAIEISNVEDVPDDLPQVLFQRKKEDRGNPVFTRHLYSALVPKWSMKVISKDF